MRPEEYRRIRLMHERYADEAGLLSPHDAFEAALDLLDMDAGLSMMLQAEARGRRAPISVTEIMALVDTYEPPPPQKLFE